MPSGTSLLPFAGRADEASVLDAKLAHHVAVVDAGTTFLDEARRNIAVFYGAAGMGKSRLLAQLDPWTRGERVEGWPAPPLPNRPVVTARLDLVDNWTVDRVLLTLRAAVAGLGIPLAAFDLGLVTRWSIARPGETPPEPFVPAGRAPIRDLRAEVQEGAAAALEGLGVAAAGFSAQAIVELVEVLRRHRGDRRTVAACPHLETILTTMEQRRDDLSAAGLAQLLQWDLLVGEIGRRSALLSFLDTYEMVQVHGRQAESIINRIVALTPQIFWVISGRNPLDWHKLDYGLLEHYGAKTWPELADDGDAQHRVAGLHNNAIDAILDRTSLDAAARRRLARASGGRPLHLDVALGLVNDTDGEFDIAILDRPFAALTERFLRDIPEGERDVLRGAALLRAFDPGLAAAAGAARHATAERLVRRSLIDLVQGPLGFRMHDAIRAAIRDAPIEAPDAWAEPDWREAAERAMSALRTRVQELEMPDDQLALLLIAFELAGAEGLEPSWMFRACLQDQPRTEQVARLLVGRSGDARDGSWAHAFEQLLSVWLEPWEDRIDGLAGVANDADLPVSVRRSAHRRLAYHLRAFGRHVEAEQTFTQLRALPGADIPLHRYQHALSFVHLGRFRTAAELVSDLEGHRGPGGYHDRIDGETRLAHGQLEAAAAAVARRAAHFEAARSVKLAVELRVGEARLRAFLDPDTPAVPAAIALAQDHAILGDLRAAYCAEAIAAVGDPERVERALRSAAATARRAARPSESYNELLARWFDAAVRRDEAAFETARASAPSLGFDARWIRPMLWWRADALGQDHPAFDDVEWLLASQDEVRQRWLEVLYARRALLGLSA